MRARRVGIAGGAGGLAEQGADAADGAQQGRETLRGASTNTCTPRSRSRGRSSGRPCRSRSGGRHAAPARVRVVIASSVGCRRSDGRGGGRGVARVGRHAVGLASSSRTRSATRLAEASAVARSGTSVRSRRAARACRSQVLHNRRVSIVPAAIGQGARALRRARRCTRPRRQPSQGEHQREAEQVGDVESAAHAGSSGR